MYQALIYNSTCSPGVCQFQYLSAESPLITEISNYRPANDTNITITGTNFNNADEIIL